MPRVSRSYFPVGLLAAGAAALVPLLWSSTSAAATETNHYCQLRIWNEYQELENLLTSSPNTETSPPFTMPSSKTYVFDCGHNGGASGLIVHVDVDPRSSGHNNLLFIPTNI